MDNQMSGSPLHQELQTLGARDMEACMQCGTCASACPLSEKESTFPRKIYRYLQLGLQDKLLESPEPWLCYYCGDCNSDCPRGAEPAETMMAARRWLTTQYDWTGLAAIFYRSPTALMTAVSSITALVILLFVVLHGPVVTDRVELNTFAPAHWVHVGDEIIIALVMGLLLSNGFNMYRKIMQGTSIPLMHYIREFPVFLSNYFTQKKWRKCGTGPSSQWWRHLFLFSGWVAMEVLVMIFLTSFQTDIVHPFWHPTRIVGYYATIALIVGSGSMLYSRLYVKEKNLHRYSDFTDLLFLWLILIIAVTGILVHIARLSGWPLTTYTLYVVHVAICVAMLMIMIPFGKLSHLLYRPLAIFLTTIKQSVQAESHCSLDSLRQSIGDTFQSCMQCGSCSSICPKAGISTLNPRAVLRNTGLGRASNTNADLASWDCATCNSCVNSCPREIDVVELMQTLRGQTLGTDLSPVPIEKGLASLRDHSNPWRKPLKTLQTFQQRNSVPPYSADLDYYLFTCCSSSSAEPESPEESGAADLITVLKQSGVAFGSNAGQESCCGDIARNSGENELAQKSWQQNGDLFHQQGVKQVVTSSPHCLTTFNQKDFQSQIPVSVVHYTELLAEKIAGGQLQPLKSLPRKVTYHDPCYLGRYNEVYDAPRKILQAIPDLTLLEMQNNRERSACCGGGGGGVFQKNGPVKDSAEARLNEAIQTGAEILVTACPYCLQIFKDVLAKKHQGSSIEVKDLASLLLESTGVSEEQSYIDTPKETESYHPIPEQKTESFSKVIEGVTS